MNQKLSENNFSSMKLTDMFSHLNSVSGSYHTHWNFYSAVVFGVIAAITITDNSSVINPKIGMLLIAGLILFFIPNFLRIAATYKEITVINTEISRILENTNVDSEFNKFYAAKKHKRVNSMWWMFHISVDILLLLAIICRVYLSKACGVI